MNELCVSMPVTIIKIHGLPLWKYPHISTIYLIYQEKRHCIKHMAMNVRQHSVLFHCHQLATSKFSDCNLLLQSLRLQQFHILSDSLQTPDAKSELGTSMPKFNIQSFLHVCLCTIHMAQLLWDGDLIFTPFLQNYTIFKCGCHGVSELLNVYFSRKC